MQSYSERLDHKLSRYDLLLSFILILIVLFTGGFVFWYMLLLEGGANTSTRSLVMGALTGYLILLAIVLHLSQLRRSIGMSMGSLEVVLKRAVQLLDQGKFRGGDKFDRYEHEAEEDLLLFEISLHEAEMILERVRSRLRHPFLPLLRW